MGGETNGNTFNGVNLEGNSIENAFSDLISEFFEEGNDEVTGKITAGQVIDWDSVADGFIYTNDDDDDTNIEIAENITDTIGTTIYTKLDTIGDIVGTETGETISDTTGTTIYTKLDTIGDTAGTETGETISDTTGTTLYTNLDTIGDITGTETAKTITDTTGTTLYTNLDTIGDTTGTETDTTTGGTTGVYKTFETTENQNIQTIEKNAYGVITVNGDLLDGLNTEETAGTIGDGNGDTIATPGTDFKLTQGNLPAKIGFWTKVRNFFISDSKLQYSVQEPSYNGGVWNKLQNLFSFGKNK